jgi:hypothetical protein
MSEASFSGSTSSSSPPWLTVKPRLLWSMSEAAVESQHVERGPACKSRTRKKLRRTAALVSSPLVGRRGKRRTGGDSRIRELGRLGFFFLQNCALVKSRSGRVIVKLSSTRREAQDTDRSAQTRRMHGCTKGPDS